MDSGKNQIKTYLKECLDSWPDSIDMCGAQFIPESGGYLFPELIKVHDLLQDSIKTDLGGLVMYEVFGFFFWKMKENLLQGRNTPVSKTLSVDELLTMVEQEVLESDCKKMKKQFAAFK